MTELEVTTRDGRRLHAERHGPDAPGPVVVFEAGMGASRSTWGGVVPLLGPDVAAVVYDRSGLGRSPADPAPRGLDRLADDLIDVLDHLARHGHGPAVLVGHSWGGPIVRVVAARIPDRIAGLVLVDQTDETCDLFFAPGAERQQRFARRTMPFAARLGLLRFVAGRLARSLPEPAASAMRAEDGTATATATQLAELDHHLDDLRHLRDHPPVLPDVPITSISGGRIGLGERRRRPALIAAHRAAVTALPRGRHVVAERSGHLVPLTEPAVVAAEIRRILESLGELDERDSLARRDAPDEPTGQPS